jgi:hypothetical protein
MLKSIKVVVLPALPLLLCACSSSPTQERYLCPNCGTQMVKVGQSMAYDKPATRPAGAAPAAALPPQILTQGQATSSKVYPVSARQMVQVVQEAVTAAPLNLKVEAVNDGVIVTSYKDGYRGNLHIARYWQERTRFRIAVIPAVNDPVNACRVEVADESQERSNDRAGWQDRADIRRPERAQEVIQAIEAKLH